MFVKKKERVYDSGKRPLYVKYYTYDSKFYDLIDKVAYSGLKFSSVDTADEGDVGMKYFGGKYSYEDFMELYDRAYRDMEFIEFHLADYDDAFIRFRKLTESLSFNTYDPDLDLNDVIKE